MEQLSFEKPYDRNAVNWRKSVEELSKFIYDRVGDEDFFDFLREGVNNELSDSDKEKMERWQTRLDDLHQKITKRMGYRVDKSKLLTEAVTQILDRRDSGEFVPNNRLDRFCERSMDWLQEQEELLELS